MAAPAAIIRGRRVHPQSWSRLVRSNRLLGSRPVRAQQTVDVEIVWLPTTHTITPQATLTHKPAALEQAHRPPVIDPDEGVHPIDLVLSESPLNYRSHGLAHQPLAPVSLRQVERQLGPAVYLGPLVETAGADKLVIVLERDPPSGQLARRPTAQRPLDHCFDHRHRRNGIAGQLSHDGIAQVGVERGSVSHTERAQARSVEVNRRRMLWRVCHGSHCPATSCPPNAMRNPRGGLARRVRKQAA